MRRDTCALWLVGAAFEELPQRGRYVRAAGAAMMHVRAFALIAFWLAVPAAAWAGALPEVAAGPRPGPDVLYAPLASAPQFENAAPWQAAPLRVSGTEGYAAGEYLWQDWIFDAYGANTTNLPAAPPDTAPASATGAASAPTGDVVYPSDAAVYGFDAADLLELRVKRVPGGLAYRLTLNTMLVPDAAIAAIGIDTDANPATGSNDLGHGLGALGTLGVEHVIATWGTGAELDGTSLASSADTTRNQIHLEVPLVPPPGATWRHYLVVGLHAASTHTFKAIGILPTATEPGGSHLTTPPPVFNVGFRFAAQEPMGSDPMELGGRGAYFFGGWREHAQAKALAARDISAFHADIDFGLLDAAVTDLRIPTTGVLDRLAVSHLDLGEGATADQTLGVIQPYAVYLPSSYVPGTPAPVQPLLHSAAANYNQIVGSIQTIVDALGEDRGAIVFTPEARGPTVGYGGIGEVDTFEVWADLAHHYDLDFSRAALSGFSMGAIGSFRLASLYPDLFTRGLPMAGHGEAVTEIADNLYHVPLLMWNGVPDELIPIAQVLLYRETIAGLGYRHEQHVFPTRDHIANPIGGAMDFSTLTPFVAGASIDLDPSRVVYRYVPAMDDSALGLVYDHAYWVSDIAVAAGAANALVDVRSRARGEADPTLVDLAGPATQPEPHEVLGLAWTANAEPPANALEARLTDVSSVGLWLQRAGIDAAVPVTLHLESSAAVSLALAAAWPGPVSVIRDGASAGTLTPVDGAITLADAGVHDYLLFVDADGDGIPPDSDNCPFVANADQLDRGGVNTTTSDGIGDACQCGDVNGSGIVNGQDANAIKRHGLGQSNPLFTVPGNCDVSGNGSCNGQDANAVTRAALGQPSPLFGQNCHNALGLPVPPDL